VLKSMEAKSEMTPDESRCRTIERRDLPTIGRAVGFNSAVAVRCGRSQGSSLRPSVLRLGSVSW